MEGVFDSLNVTLIIASVLLLIAALVVRDQTEFRVSQLRSELVALRNEEKRLSERRDEIELMVAQIGDALMRADRRTNAFDKGLEQVSEILEALGSAVTETPQNTTES
jgi:hypothetical protein